MSTALQLKLSNSLGNKTKYLAELKKTFLRPLIQIAVKAIEDEHIEEGVLDRICCKYNISDESVDEYYAAVLTILKISLCSLLDSAKPVELKQCLEDLKLSPDCIEDLIAVIYGQKQNSLLSGITRKTKFYPHLVSCRWRVDITISSSILSKVLEPCIIMEWIFDSGERHIFELSLAKFHHLRHTIASILVEMQILEQQGALKNVHCN